MKRSLYRRIANALLDFENWLFGEGIPDDWVKVDYTYVIEKLLEVYPFAKLRIVDQYYYLCDRETIEEFLASDQTEQERYVTDFHDCDDFSFRLMGQFHIKPYSALAFGVAHSKVHAYNIFLSKDGFVFLIEPQTDEIFPERKEEAYETDWIIM